jgi:hypothetical protein
MEVKLPLVGVSDTVMGPLVWGPLFETVRVYRTGLPLLTVVGLPLSDEMARSADWITVVVRLLSFAFNVNGLQVFDEQLLLDACCAVVTQVHVWPPADAGIETVSVSVYERPGRMEVPFTWALVELVAAQGDGGFFWAHDPSDVPEMVKPELAGTVIWKDPMACVVPTGASLPIFNVTDCTPDPAVVGLRTAQ